MQRTLSFQSINRGPRGILCTRGEKAHTSKRMSIIACNKVISKAQCATHRPEGTPHYKTHARYFCTCVEKKAHTSKRMSIIACNKVISKAQCATHRPEGTPHYKTHARYFCTCVEKKAHKSKRGSIIACNNVISKAQCAPCGSDIVFDSDIALQ